MSEFCIILIAILAFASLADYLYVNVGEVYTDETGTMYQVMEKNFLFVRIKSNYEQKNIPIMVLCMKYMKIGT